MASMQETGPEDSSKRGEEQEATKKEAQKEMSLEEIGHYRGVAQQNSLEAMKAAEDRYSRAKESAAMALKETKEAVGEGLSAAAAYATSKGVEAKEYAQQTASLAAEKGRRGMEMAVEKGSQAYEAAKDVTVSTGKNTAEYVREKTVGAVATREETDGDEEKEGTTEEIRGEELSKKKKKTRIPHEELEHELGYLEIQEKTTAMEDLYEAVGKTVLGIADFVKNLVVGGEAKPGEEKK